MKKLSTDWFMEGTLDYEYKKYVLLAYLQHVSKEFADYRLYPSFSELIFHYNNLNTFKENKRRLTDKFPTHLNREEFKRLRLQYEAEELEYDELMEIESIINYSLPTIQYYLKEGKSIYEEIDSLIEIEPIGITPLYKKEGYVLLRTKTRKEVKAYMYRVIFLENTEGNYYGINFDFVDQFHYNIGQTYEKMKRDLIRSHKNMPNPATYLLLAKSSFPEIESLIPVAKRKMLTFLK